MKDYRRSVNGREVCFAIVRVEFVPAMLDSSTKFLVGLVILKLWYLLLVLEVYI